MLHASNWACQGFVANFCNDRPISGGQTQHVDVVTSYRPAVTELNGRQFDASVGRILVGYMLNLRFEHGFSYPTSPVFACVLRTSLMSLNVV
jgi:hypothetical protein